MPKYIVLGKFTAEGIKNIKDSPKRLEAANKLAEHEGFEVPFGVVFYGSSWSVSVEVCPEGGLDGG